ncbi:hypothetical protein CHLRE_10g458000v5 [Chlamydomonas reinhardtii]|uniref:Sulfotransferase n=1 Tax=Chlamydomonas reinhardtii TaxID=3055 RepID=A0A2K3DBN4_CHLRE|nr:uncharacterized protein CHLRE_10g458000v5 [Chlamydomonas reinhardtii]PNW77944.1 hypothetical protein CHLRE_10g458000v5 [Chlamydomonas reinhardtii]
MCWSKRHLPLLLVAGLACTITITYAADPVSDVLEKYFGKLVEDAQAKEKLVSHLDTLLKLGAKRPGEGLRVVHEYEDEKAKTLGVEVVPTLTAGSVNAWADQALELLRGVDEGHTYSLLRRVITAALLKLWLEGGQKLPDGSSDKLKEVMLKLYAVHRLGSVQKGVMEFLHVSKSGGTSWCHIAQLNGCVTERYDQSYVCQVKAFDDKVRWLNMTYHMQQVPVYRVPRYVLNRFSRFGNFRRSHAVAACRARHAIVHHHDYNYYSNEYTVHGGHEGPENAHMCPDIFNAVVMRDPRKRLVSHMKFIMWTMSGDRGYNDTQLFNMMYGNRTAAFWQHLGPAVVDNYFIRSLLGEVAFHAPVGGITRDMLALAEQVLAQFDLVMVLEQDVDIRNLILYYGVGWKHTLEEVHDKDAAVREKEFNTTAYIPPDVDALLEAQSLDVELYDFSQTLALLDPVVYALAAGSGEVPLKELAAASDTDDLHCGLLRGLNNSQILPGIGGTVRKHTGLLSGISTLLRGLGVGGGKNPRARGGRARAQSGAGDKAQRRLLGLDGWWSRWQSQEGARSSAQQAWVWEEPESEEAQLRGRRTLAGAMQDDERIAAREDWAGKVEQLLSRAMRSVRQALPGWQ